MADKSDLIYPKSPIDGALGSTTRVGTAKAVWLTAASQLNLADVEKYNINLYTQGRPPVSGDTFTTVQVDPERISQDVAVPLFRSEGNPETRLVEYTYYWEVEAERTGGQTNLVSVRGEFTLYPNRINLRISNLSEDQQVTPGAVAVRWDYREDPDGYKYSNTQVQFRKVGQATWSNGAVTAADEQARQTVLQLDPNFEYQIRVRSKLMSPFDREIYTPWIMVTVQSRDPYASGTMTLENVDLFDVKISFGSDITISGSLYSRLKGQTAWRLIAENVGKNSVIIDRTPPLAREIEYMFGGLIKEIKTLGDNFSLIQYGDKWQHRLVMIQDKSVSSKLGKRYEASHYYGRVYPVATFSTEKEQTIALSARIVTPMCDLPIYEDMLLGSTEEDWEKALSGLVWYRDDYGKSFLAALDGPSFNYPRHGEVQISASLIRLDEERERPRHG